MPLPDRDGRFRAYPVEWGVDETGPNKLVTFTCRWRIVQWYGDKDQEWYDFTAENSEITSYTYLQKRDGGVNTTGVEQLQAALGWDGRDLEALANTNWAETGCSIVTAWDTYQGKTKLKVQWVDNWDPTSGPGGGVAKADSAKLKTMQASFGGQLRATTPAQAAPVAGKIEPEAKPKPAPPPPPQATGTGQDVSDDDIPF